jgi:DNA-binding transcriptional MerR regulator
MNNKYITAGEFAKIAGTSKRTIQFYHQKGVLKPALITDNKYRYYLEKQVLDYQMILLLSTYGVTLAEIKLYLVKGGQLVDLFNEKKSLIRAEIERLKFNLENMDLYMENLRNNGTFVNPTIKVMEQFKVYYIEKSGPYAEIGRYCSELKQMFSNVGNKFVTMAIFESTEYQPRKTKIKIATFYNEKLKAKKKYKEKIKILNFNPGKVISYIYKGRGDMLSLFWKELEKYAKQQNLKVRKDIPDFEIYWQISDNISKQKFEIFLPIE